MEMVWCYSLNRNIKKINTKKNGRISSDVLQHTSILILQVIVNYFLMYSSQLIRFNDNSS
jgi:hypothetical protein